MRDKNSYPRAVNYCSRYVDGDSTKLIDKQLQLIRKFERTYPNEKLSEFPISRIPTCGNSDPSKKAPTAGNLYSFGKVVSKKTGTKMLFKKPEKCQSG